MDFYNNIIFRTGRKIVSACYPNNSSQQEHTGEKGSKSLNDLNLLSDMARLFSSNLSSDMKMRTMLEKTVKLLNAEAGTVALLEENGEDSPDLKFQYTYGKAAENLEGICLQTGHGLIGWVVSNNQPAVVNDVTGDDRFFQWCDQESGFKTRSVVCSPIISNSAVIGAIEIINKKEGLFDESDLSLLNTAVHIATLSITNSELSGKQNHNYFNTLVSISSILSKANSTEEVVKDVLELIGWATGASSSLWFQNKNDPTEQTRMGLRAEWCIEENLSQRGNPRLHNIEYEQALPHWFQELSANKIISGVATEFRAKERDLLECLSIKAIVNVPLFIDRNFSGFISLANCVSETPWREAEVHLVRAAADSLSKAFEYEKTKTDQIKLQEQLLHSQSMESLGEIASGISHNFRNILTGIIANCQLIQIKYHDHTEVQHSISGILNLAEVGSELISNLLKFSRKGIKGPNTVFNLTEVLEETHKIISRSFDKKIEIRKDWPEKLPIEGVHSEIGQVFMNLCTNARDAMMEGGILQIEARQTNGKISIVISDTGCGMDEKTIQRIFEPFFTTKETGKGTGLGLSTVYGIIKDHGGEISVSSKTGVGTIFHIFFPTPKAKGIDQQAPPEPIIQGNGQKVLIVDDDESLLQPLENMLKNIGYKTKTATSGQLGIDKYETWQPDVVLVDRNMPGMDGITTVEHIFSIDPAANIVIVSGYDDIGPDGIDSRMKDSIKAYITKPFHIAKLSQVLTRVING